MNVLLDANERLLLARLGLCEYTFWLKTQADLNSVSHYAHEHDVGVPIRIHHWPFFELIIYALPLRRMQDLTEIQSAFVSGLPPPPFVSPQCPEERARRRSCPPTLGEEKHDNLLSPPRKNRTRHQEDRKARRTLQQAILQRTPGTVSKAQPQGVRSTNQQQIAKDRQSGSLQYLSATTKVNRSSQGVPSEQQSHSHNAESDVVDDSDASSTTVDFLAALRQIDPQRALDLEHQYDFEMIQSIDL
jgi:hypothetical protein